MVGRHAYKDLSRSFTPVRMFERRGAEETIERSLLGILEKMDVVDKPPFGIYDHNDPSRILLKLT